MTTSTEVCVIGSGVAGGVVCSELLAAGAKSIVMLEQGGPVLMRDQRIWHDLVMTNDDRLFADGHLELEHRDIGPTPYNASALLQARGGSTVHWDGFCFRLKPEDFRLRTNTGIGADWPVSYDELEPSYTEAERTLQVAGEARDEGHPPRSGPFPLPAYPYQASDDPFLEAMEKLDFSVQHNCIARNTLPINDRPQCMTFGTCLYCPLGARFTGDQLIDRLEQMPGFHLRCRTRVQRILFSSKGRAVGVEVCDLKTHEITTIEAETIVVCGGGIQSPKLLLQSANDWWPRGVGNDHDKLGRYLMNHVTAGPIGVLAPNPKHLMNELVSFSTVKSRHFDSEKFQSQGKFMIDEYKPFYVKKLPVMLLADEPLAVINKELDARVYVHLIGMMEQFPEAENRVTLGKKAGTDGLPLLEVAYSVSPKVMAGLERMRETMAVILRAMGCETLGVLEKPVRPQTFAHHMGTCRMSRLPEDGVVDQNLRVHGTDNLFICGSSVFPSGGAANPTLTVVALAHRLGKHLAARYRHAP